MAKIKPKPLPTKPGYIVDDSPIVVESHAIGGRQSGTAVRHFTPATGSIDNDDYVPPQQRVVALCFDGPEVAKRIAEALNRHNRQG